MNRLQILLRGCGVAALIVAALLFAAEASAFKIQTHVASANRTLDEPAGKIRDSNLPETLVLEVGGLSVLTFPDISMGQRARALGAPNRPTHRRASPYAAACVPKMRGSAPLRSMALLRGLENWPNSDSPAREGKLAPLQADWMRVRGRTSGPSI